MGYNKYGLLSNYTMCQRTGHKFIWFDLYQISERYEHWVREDR